MKISIIKGQQTVLYDTGKFTKYEEWIDLVHEVGCDMFELSERIDKAKYQRRVNGTDMPKPEWQRLNKARLLRIKQWKLLAEHLTLMWPDKICFTANKVVQLLAREDPKLYTKLFEQAKATATEVDIGTEKPDA